MPDKQNDPRVTALRVALYGADPQNRLDGVLVKGRVEPMLVRSIVSPHLFRRLLDTFSRRRIAPVKVYEPVSGQQLLIVRVTLQIEDITTAGVEAQLAESEDRGLGYAFDDCRILIGSDVMNRGGLPIDLILRCRQYYTSLD